MKTSLFDHAQALEAAFKMLQSDWQASREVWQDKVRDEFEAEHWNNLAAYSRATQRALQGLAEVVAKAQQSVK